MTVDSVIEWARSRQADQFTQTMTVQRPIGEAYYDEDIEMSVQEVVTIYTDLPCKISSIEAQGEDRQAGQTEVRIVELMVKFPVGTDVAMNDVVTITSSHFNTLDVGRHYRITDVDHREREIARRCAIEETNVPMLWEGS